MKPYGITGPQWVPTSNTLRPRRNGRHFADNIFKGIFFNESIWFSIKIPMKFVPYGLINNIPSIVSDNGLAPTGRQAIFWTNDGLGYWPIYVTLCLNELIHQEETTKQSTTIAHKNLPQYQCEECLPCPAPAAVQCCQYSRLYPCSRVYPWCNEQLCELCRSHTPESTEDKLNSWAWGYSWLVLTWNATKGQKGGGAIHFTRFMRKTTRLKSSVGFWPDKFPLKHS